MPKTDCLSNACNSLPPQLVAAGLSAWHEKASSCQHCPPASKPQVSLTCFACYIFRFPPLGCVWFFGEPNPSNHHLRHSASCRCLRHSAPCRCLAWLNCQAQCMPFQRWLSQAKIAANLKTDQSVTRKYSVELTKKRKSFDLKNTRACLAFLKCNSS